MGELLLKYFGHSPLYVVCLNDVIRLLYKYALHQLDVVPLNQGQKNDWPLRTY